MRKEARVELGCELVVVRPVGLDEATRKANIDGQQSLKRVTRLGLQ
jgi:hypothetical protein